MYNVLLVTADRGLREAGSRVLASAGLTVVTAAHSGHALLACLGAVHFDVLVIEEEQEDAPDAVPRRLVRHQPGMRVVRVGRPHAGIAGTDRPDLVRPFIADDLLAAVALAAVRQPAAAV